MNTEDIPTQYHNLNGKWDLYYHLPNDKNWDLNSYKTIMNNIDKNHKTLIYIFSIIIIMSFIGHYFNIFIDINRIKKIETIYEEEGLNKLFPIDFSGVYAGMASDAIGEAYCTTDACEIKLVKDNQ